MIRLYIASDYPVVRAGLRAILEASSECEVAGDGGLEEAIARVVELRPDVVLLEPGGEPEGTESLWRLLAEMPELGVVVLGDPGEMAAREALQAGARGYLLRDASPEEILAAIQAINRGLAVLDPVALRALLPQSQPSEPRASAESLSERELQVLRLLAEGLASKTIASRLSISEHTVKFHVGSILAKLGAASRTEAVAVAIRRGLIAL